MYTDGFTYECDEFLDVCNPDGTSDFEYMTTEDIQMMDDVMIQDTKELNQFPGSSLESTYTNLVCEG